MSTGVQACRLVKIGEYMMDIVIMNWQTLGLLSCYVVGTFYVIWKIINGEIL